MKKMLALAAAAACALGTSALAGGQQPTFRGGSDAVRVFVTVTDRDGRLVTTLTQAISKSATRASRSRSRCSTISLNRFGSSSCSTCRAAWKATCRCCGCRRSSCSRGCGPDDVARVGAFGHDVTISPTFTRDPDELRRGAARRDRARCADAALACARRGPRGVRASDETRTVILVLSDGKDSGPDEPAPAHRQPGGRDRSRAARRRDDLRDRHAQPRGSAAPGIGPGGLQAMLMADLPDMGLARVAEETGGGYTEIRLGQDLGAAFARSCRRAAHPVSSCLRPAETRRQGPRRQRSREPVRDEVTREEELRGAEGMMI